MPSRSNWIESHTDLRYHPKLEPTASALGITPAQLCGHLHFLWHWCLDYQDDGDVTRYSAKILADAAGFDGDCNAFIDALRNGGWLDNGRALTIHNWDEYAGKLLRKRASGRTRSQRFREKEEGDALRNGLTVPYRTEPNRTKRDLVHFSPPTLDEAKDYFTSKGVNGSEFQKFVMHYESKGWLVGKTKMKNWRAAAAGWIMRSAEGGQS